MFTLGFHDTILAAAIILHFGHSLGMNLLWKWNTYYCVKFFSVRTFMVKSILIWLIQHYLQVLMPNDSKTSFAVFIPPTLTAQ